jgi:hypothetical protein
MRRIFRLFSTARNKSKMTPSATSQYLQHFINTRLACFTCTNERKRKREKEKIQFVTVISNKFAMLS